MVGHMMFRAGETVVRVRRTPGGWDEYGDPIPGTESRDDIDGVAVTFRRAVTGDVNDRGREGVIVGLTLYLPAGVDVLHTDQFEVRGALYDVDGEPAVWRSPFTGWRPGVEVALRRAEG